MASSDITLNRGKLYFDRFNSSGASTGLLYMGLSNDMPMTPKIDTYEVVNSDNSQKFTAAILPIKTDVSGDFTLEEASWDNLSLYFNGSKSVVTQTATAVTDELLTSSLALGRYYQIGGTGSVRGIGTVTVKSGSDTSGAATTSTLTTDYTFDAATGLLYVPATSGLTAGNKIWITYTPDASTHNRIQVLGGTVIEGSMRFISDPARGEPKDYWIPYCSLIAAESFALKSDENQKLKFTYTALKSGSLPLIELNGRKIA